MDEQQAMEIDEPRISLNERSVGIVERQLELLTRKGVYPYEYMSSFDKFEETSLPVQVIYYHTPPYMQFIVFTCARLS